MRMKVTPTTIAASACAVLLALNLLTRGTSVAVAQESAGIEGACCDVVQNGDCQWRTEESCAKIGGIYYGDGVEECPPDSPCEILGACCYGILKCRIRSEPGCFNGGANSGIWKGPDTNCDDADFNGISDVCDTTICMGDLDGDGEVGIVDFLFLLALWGPCE